MPSMNSYTPAALERAMKVQEVMLQAMAQKISWWQAAEILGISDRADEWLTHLLCQGDSQVFKRYSQMKLQMNREALKKINRRANEMPLDSVTAMIQ